MAAIKGVRSTYGQPFQEDAPTASEPGRPRRRPTTAIAAAVPDTPPKPRRLEIWAIMLLLGAAALEPWPSASAQVAAISPGPHRPAPQVRDCAECPELVLIPAGTYMRGIPADETKAEGGDAADDYARPVRQVEIRTAFYMARTDVTVGQFRAFVARTHYRTKAVGSWRRPLWPDRQTDNDPVVQISFGDAEAYAHWLTGLTQTRTNAVYRLPSEAEWEYAARAGTQTARYWDKLAGSACRFANVNDASSAKRFHGNAMDSSVFFRCDDGFPVTSPVGHFDRNAFGLADMLGNVSQWTRDCWNPTYDDVPVTEDAATTGDCSLRVVRGSSFASSPSGVRAGVRAPFFRDNGDGDIGFRLTRTIPGPKF